MVLICSNEQFGDKAERVGGRVVLIENEVILLIENVCVYGKLAMLYLGSRQNLQFI